MSFQKSRLCAIVMLVLFVAGISSPAWASQIKPTQDIQIYQYHPETSYPNDYLRIGFADANSDREHRTLIQFDLSPASGPVESATLWMYHALNTAGHNDLHTEVHRLTHSWDEHATWNFHDGSWDWTTAGGDYDSKVWATATVGTTMGNWIGWDVKNLVQGWVDHTFDNHGMIIKSDGFTANNESYFNSREYNLNPEHRPYLEIYMDTARGGIIPEPSTLALLCVGGLFGLVRTGRRRHRAA